VLSAAAPVPLAKENFCHGTRCLICMKYTACLEVTDVNRKGKYSMEISGVFYLSCWKQLEISHCRKQAVNWLSVFKVPVPESIPPFGALSSVKRQKKHSLGSLNFLLLLAFAFHL